MENPDLFNNNFILVEESSPMSYDFNSDVNSSYRQIYPKTDASIKEPLPSQNNFNQILGHLLGIIPSHLMLRLINSQMNVNYKKRPFFESYYTDSFAWKTLIWDVVSCILPATLIPIALTVYSLFIPIAAPGMLILSFKDLFDGKLLQALNKLLGAILLPPVLILAAVIVLPVVSIFIALFEVAIALAQIGNIINFVGSLLNTIRNIFGFVSTVVPESKSILNEEAHPLSISSRAC